MANLWMKSSSFPTKTLKLWCPNTESALQQLVRENFVIPATSSYTWEQMTWGQNRNEWHSQLHKWQLKQHRLSQHRKYSSPPSYPELISTPVLLRVNTDISRGCAGIPNVHLVHHPTLDIYSLHDHVHLRKDTVNVFAKNLKMLPLAEPLAVPQRATESSKPQPRRRLIPASSHSIFPPSSLGPTSHNPN